MKITTSSPFIYIGAVPCGCVVAMHTVTSPNPDVHPIAEWRQGLAEALSEWIMEGYTVHFVTKDEGIRLINLDCPHIVTPGSPPNPLIADAHAEYLEALRFSGASVLELQKQRELALVEAEIV